MQLAVCYGIAGDLCSLQLAAGTDTANTLLWMKAGRDPQLTTCHSIINS